MLTATATSVMETKQQLASDLFARGKARFGSEGQWNLMVLMGALLGAAVAECATGDIMCALLGGLVGSSAGVFFHEQAEGWNKTS